MDITIVGISALHYYNTPIIAVTECPAGGIAVPSPRDFQSARRAPASRIIAAHAHTVLMGVPLPVDVVINGARRTNSDVIRAHQLANPPYGAERLQIADNLYVSSPARALLDAAPHLSLMGLTQAICSFAGLYAVESKTRRLRSCLQDLEDSGALATIKGVPVAFYDENGRVEPRYRRTGAGYPWSPCYAVDDRRTDLWRRPPLVTLGECEQLALVHAGRPGATRLMRAAKLAHAGSASPSETTFALLSSIPRKLGGEHLPRPQLNRKTQLSVAAARALGLPYVVNDVSYPDERGGAFPFRCEIDGRAFHAEQSALYAPAGSRDDASRRTALLAMGIDVVSITQPQIANLERWNALMAVLRGYLDLPTPPLTRAFMRQRDALRAELLGREHSRRVGSGRE